MSRFVTNFEVGEDTCLVRDSQIMHYEGLVNAKFPPDGMKAAIGDGTQNDTNAIKALITYCINNNFPLYFPAGVYLTSPITVTGNLSIIGSEAIIRLRPIMMGPLITLKGRLIAQGVTFDGNLSGQTTIQNVIKCDNGEFRFNECTLTGGKSCIIGTIENDCNLNNCILSNYTEYGLNIKGAGRIVSTGVTIPNVASGGALGLIRLGVSNSYIGAWESVAEISVGVEITGDKNYVSVNFPNVKTPVNDGGQNNNWEVIGKSKKQTVGDFDGVASGHYSLSGNDVSLNPSNPLTYKTPSEYSEFFDSVKFKDGSGTIYDVLVANASTGSITDVTGFYNIKELGALGDGVTDDTNAFKDLNDKNGIIFVPKGNYVFNNEYTINNVTIIFDPEATMLLKNSGTNITFNNAMIINGIFEDAAESVTGGALVVLDGLSEIHNATFNCHNANRIGASAEQGSNARFVNCKFNGNSTAPFGLHCDRSENTCKLMVENCEFHDFLLNGIFSSAMLGLYRNCYFTGNHKQTEPTGGGQIDVLSNSNTPSHSIVGCFFENSGGINTPGIETYNTDVMIEGCYINSTGANYGLSLQQGPHSIVIGNHFKTNNVCIYIDSKSSGTFIGNLFENTNQSPITCAAENSNGGVCYGNMINGENQTLFNYVSSNIGMYYIAGEKNNTTFTLKQSESVNVNVGDAQYKNIMFTVDVNDSQAILLLSEFGNITWIPSAPSNVSASYSNNVITFTNSGTGEHRYSIVKK